MLLLGTKNTATQTVAVNGIIDLGAVYRKYCKKNQCGIKAFDFNTNSISLQHQGMYHVTAVLVGSSTTAGEITVQLLENGVAIPGAIASETVAGTTAQVRTFTIDYFILVDSTTILNEINTLAKTISLQNTGVGATFTSVVLNVEKVV